MKILVTVGTTKFDSLIEYIDTKLDPCSWDIEFQIANGKYLPRNYSFFDFALPQIINDIYNKSDIIITHAGCGSIYRLLELEKRIIIVPNLKRIDKHQIDIANYMSMHRYALVAYKYEQIETLLKVAPSYVFNVFHKDTFFKSNEIIEYLLTAFEK
jgi:beta-1,4-N-acetylglucosaminyltransferase